jgi:hypothetical protein
LKKQALLQAYVNEFAVVQFGQGRKWNRRYTDFYGAAGNNAWKIARDGLLSAASWSDAIDKWQAPYINDESNLRFMGGAGSQRLFRRPMARGPARGRGNGAHAGR